MAKKDNFTDKIIGHVGELVCDTVDHLVENKMIAPEYGIINLTIDLLNGQQIKADVYIIIKEARTLN